MKKLSPVEVGVVGSLEIQTHRTEPRYLGIRCNRCAPTESEKKARGCKAPPRQWPLEEQE